MFENTKHFVQAT